MSARRLSVSDLKSGSDWVVSICFISEEKRRTEEDVCFVYDDTFDTFKTHLNLTRNEWLPVLIKSVLTFVPSPTTHHF